jgi:predicted enzyme related to lactoylglutathione lyase
VADVDAAAAAVVAGGGTILIPRTMIPTVGHLIFFRDPEGNVCGAMQYDAKAQDEI